MMVIGRFPRAAYQVRRRCAPSSHRPRLGGADGDDARHGYGGRPAAQPRAAPRRECAPASASGCAPPRRQAPGHHAHGPRAPGAARRPRPCLAAGLLVVQPDTLLRWYRAGFRTFWRWKSRPGPGRPPLAAETVALIRQMAAENPLWGAERIRGELGKLGIGVTRRTIQTYLRRTRGPRPTGRAWATFLHTQARHIWACDFLPVTDLLFRPLYAFFVVELATRRVVHVGVTRHPTDAWVAQQLRRPPPSTSARGTSSGITTANSGRRSRA